MNIVQTHGTIFIDAIGIHSVFFYLAHSVESYVATIGSQYYLRVFGLNIRAPILDFRVDGQRVDSVISVDGGPE